MSFLHKYLVERLPYGRLALHPSDADILYGYCLGMKTYVEIGTLFGGSAIIAGLAGCKEVHCIDPLRGYDLDDQLDTKTKMLPSKRYLLYNWAAFDLNINTLHIHRQRHPPWPEAIDDVRFDIGFIDGNHVTDAVRNDWEGMRVHVDRFVLFHDIDKRQPKTNVGGVFDEAAADPNWKDEAFDVIAGKQVMGVLRRV